MFTNNILFYLKIFYFLHYAILQVSLFSIASLISLIVAKHPPVSILLTTALARYPVVIE